MKIAQLKKKIETSARVTPTPVTPSVTPTPTPVVMDASFLPVLNSSSTREDLQAHIDFYSSQPSSRLITSRLSQLNARIEGM